MRAPARRLSAVAVLLLLTACAGLTVQPEPPRVSLADMRLIDASLFEQRYAMALRVQNPNPFPLRIAGLEYTLQVNGASFAHGVSEAQARIPAYGERVLNVNLVGSLGETLRQLRSLAGGRIHYALEGGVHLAGRSRRLPFRHSGELDLRSLGGDAG